jgi:hypothetical protein
VEVTDIAGTSLNGIKVSVYDKVGVGFTPKVSSTANGLASFDLEYFTGTVVVVAEDPYGTYLPVTSEKNIASGSNSLTITMLKQGESVIDWGKYMPYIIGGSIGAIGLGIGAYALKRKREVMY